ncbi:hypothetical protein OC845_000630 [Tilletia horrida]|nr:hypothetical protein OC845_000630 [Tilletia horrida]
MRWATPTSASNTLQCRYSSSSVPDGEAQADPDNEEDDHSDLHVQSINSLLIEPEESAAEPTLQALDSFRPQPFNPARRRHGAAGDDVLLSANSTQKARQKHWDQTLRRVHQAFTRKQLLKIARTEIPSLDLASSQADSSSSASVKKKGGRKRRIPKGLEDSAKKADIIKFIMTHHWKMQDPRAKERTAQSAPSQTAPAPAPRPEPTEWLFYPLDKAQLFIVLTALNSSLTELANRYQAKFFAAQQEATPASASEQSLTEEDAASEGSESANLAASAQTQKGIQLTGYSASDLEAIKTWLDEELTYLYASEIDLGPIYAASDAFSNTDTIVPDPTILPSTFALQQIALRTGSYIEPESDTTSEDQPEPNVTSGRQHQTRYQYVTATSPSKFHEQRTIPMHPAELLRQHAAKHRDHAQRPIYIYSPTTPASLSANLSSDEAASTKRRTQYAFTPHYNLKSRDYLYNLGVDERAYNLRQTTASLLPSDWVNEQSENQPALQEQVDQQQQRDNPYSIGGAAVQPHWRLERSMVTDAFEGRGGLGFSLGYGSDLDLEQARAAQRGQEDEDTDVVETDAPVHGVKVLKDVEAGEEPTIFLAAPGAVDSSGPRPASVLEHLIDSDASSSSGRSRGEPQQHIYSATFGHLRFPSALPVEEVWTRSSTERTQMHGIFHPPLPGSWPINRLQKSLIRNESTIVDRDESTSDSKTSSSQATSWWSQPQRPTFVPALPPIALLPPSAVSNTLSGIKSTSPAGDAWTRLMTRAFGELPSSLGNQPPWMSQSAADESTHSAALMAGLAKRPGSVLVEALKWMRAFKKRKQQQQEKYKLSQQENSQGADQAQTTDAASADVITTQSPLENASSGTGAGSEEKVRASEAVGSATTKAEAPRDISQRPSLPTEEDISRFTYVPITADDRSKASGRRLVVEAASRYAEDGALLPEFDLLRAYWEVERRQADVAIPDSSIDLRMGACSSLDVPVENVLSSEQLRSFFDGESAEPGAIAITSSRIPMVHCYYHSMAAPSSISFPTALAGEGGTAAAAAQDSLKLQLETVQVLSRTSWPVPEPAPAPASKPTEDSKHLQAWVVEELVYLPGSPDALNTMRIEWRTSGSTRRPAWSELAEDLDLLLDVPYGVCKGRPTYAPL